VATQSLEHVDQLALVRILDLANQSSLPRRLAEEGTDAHDVTTRFGDSSAQLEKDSVPIRHHESQTQTRVPTGEHLNESPEDVRLRDHGNDTIVFIHHRPPADHLGAKAPARARSGRPRSGNAYHRPSSFSTSCGRVVYAMSSIGR